MIKVADTPEKYKKCLDFLKKFNYELLMYSILFYVEEDEIISVCGYHKDWGAMIEPMYSEESLRGVKAGRELYEFMTEYLKTLGHLIIRFKTQNEALVKLMEKHYGFKKQESLTYMVKEL